jgi:protoporphyrinogen oxidase
MKRIVILGAGPCGLAAAWELIDRDLEVVVIEKEAQVGGLGRTFEYNGFRFDVGGHRFITASNALLQRVCNLMGDELITSTRRSIILLRGEQFQYPLSAGDFLHKLPLWTCMRIVADYLIEVARMKLHPQPDISFEDWVVHRFGGTAYGLFFGPYTEKLWGISPRAISADWAPQRISLLNLWDVARRMLGLQKGTPRTYALKYLYPKHGFGRIFEVMAEELKKAGTTIHLHAELSQIHREKNRVVAVEFLANGRKTTLECDAVISSIPLPDLLKRFNPEMPLDVLASTDALRFRALRCLNILLNREDVSANTWMYVAEPKYVMNRIQEPKRRSPFNAPEGKTSLMLEITCNYGDRIWEASDHEIYERVARDLNELGFDIQSQVIDYFSTRAQHAYPVYTLDYRHHRGHLINALRPMENLITSGRQGNFRYVFSDTAMEMGIHAARCLLGKASKDTLYDMKSEKDLIETKSII